MNQPALECEEACELPVKITLILYFIKIKRIDFHRPPSIFPPLLSASKYSDKKTDAEGVGFDWKINVIGDC
ncbi:hypothetical protein GCM10011445_35580 [Pseudocitrobacter faecalis]|nr:hypothetical protein GCM10011445_35580 [Pseudocitrobacter faecalis]